MNRPLFTTLFVAGSMIAAFAGVAVAVNDSTDQLTPPLAHVKPVATVTRHHDPVFIRCADKVGDDDMQPCYHAPYTEPGVDDPRAYLIWHEEIWIDPDASR